jgi:hypothetical protein
MDFAEDYAERTKKLRAIKMLQVVRRAMAIEARSKIKPNIMRPSLRDMSEIRGGGSLDLYYPGK